MEVLIVEDIIATSNLIKNRIETLIPDIKEIYQAFTLEEAEVKILSCNFDIIFWDVNMPKGTSFDLLKKLSLENKITFESIFVTGEKESTYVINALKFSAIDYLYKPLDDEELVVATNKAIEKRLKSKSTQQIDFLLQMLSTSSNESKKVAFNLIKGTTIFIELDHIVMLEADGVITDIHLNDKTILHASKNLGFYKSFLLEKDNFFQVSHAVIANVKEVEAFDNKNLIIKFKNGTSTSVSRRRAKDFKDFLSGYDPKSGLINKILSFFKG